MKTGLYKFAFFMMVALAFSSQAFATTRIITVDAQFNPLQTFICIGDTVKWTWISGTHTTTSGVLPAGAATWNANITSASPTFTYVPTVAGVYNYNCTPDQGMIGATGVFVVGTPMVLPQINRLRDTGCLGVSVVLYDTLNKNVIHHWFLNGNLIPSAILDHHLAIQTGVYTVRDSNGCGITNTSPPANISIFPVPSVPTISQTHTGATYTFTSNAPGTGLTYAWDFGDGTTSAAQSPPPHTYTTSGQKIVNLVVTTTGAGCLNSSSTNVNVSLGVSTIIGHTEYSLSPNPAANSIRLKNGAAATIILMDATGRRIDGLRRKTIAAQDAWYDISDVPAGLYMLHISTPNGEGLLKLQIAR